MFKTTLIKLLTFVVLLAGVAADATCNTDNTEYLNLNRAFNSNAGSCTTDGNNIVTSTSTCQCTGCDQMEIYMANQGELCNNGIWSHQPCTKTDGSAAAATTCQ